jgi:hypothetical protein
MMTFLSLPKNDQTFLAPAYLKTASNALFREKRPYIVPARPKTTKHRTWT